MRRKTALFLGLILILGLLASCGGPKEPPVITVTIGETEIPWVIGLNAWDGAVYDRMDSFIYFIDTETIPEAAVGDTVTITFPQSRHAPNSVELRDRILQHDGTGMFNTKSDNVTELVFKEGQASFTLEPHMAMMLSSDSTAFEDGCLRGFVFTCNWGADECEYAFVLNVR